MKTKAMLVITVAAVFAVAAGMYFRSARNFMYSPPVVFAGPTVSLSMATNDSFQSIVGQASRGLLNVLPPSARDVFVCDDMNRDAAYWVAFSLPAGEIVPFLAKELNISQAQLTDGIASEKRKINTGPSSRDGAVGNGLWDTHLTKNGKHYEKDQWYLGLDEDRNRIFMCYWTM